MRGNPQQSVERWGQSLVRRELTDSLVRCTSELSQLWCRTSCVYKHSSKIPRVVGRDKVSGRHSLGADRWLARSNLWGSRDSTICQNPDKLVTLCSSQTELSQTLSDTLHRVGHWWPTSDRYFQGTGLELLPKLLGGMQVISP